MPRLLAAEYVYSGAMDDPYDYVTTAASPQDLPSTLQQTIATPPIVDAPQNINVTTNMPANILNNTQVSAISQNPEATSLQQQEEPTTPKVTEQHIHTISSSDDDEEEIVVEQNTIEEEITNISSDECGDFEGFEDFTTPNSSGLINDASQEDLNVSSNCLKRHSFINFNDYREDSEGVVEAIEVEDDDEEIAIGEDGEIFYRTIDETTPKKTQTYRCEPHTPNKRKKQENDNYFNAISPTLLKTPPDQIVEVNSDSTTNSLKQKRQQINTKFQLNLSQQQHKIQQNPNKCSTESTSEFPVSSPSNPQQPRGGKYPPRPPLLKNTLPADSFERQLAMITACNPQMSLVEKIQSWQCDEELSDVEDVNRFDEEFKRVEKQKKLEMKQREKSGRLKNTECKNYDFFTFRQMLLSNMNEQQKNKKLKTNNQTGAGFVGISGNKCRESSGSESSKSVVHVDERPSTSAVAQQQLQQRRCKPTQIHLETGEPKKRLVKEQPKRNQNSTTPPQTSSSDNERECFQNSKSTLNHQNKLNSRQMSQQKNKLLQLSSSEEAISQEAPKHKLMKCNNKVSPQTMKNVHKNTTTNHLQPPGRSLTPNETLNNTNSLTKNPRILTDEEIDSVFRLHRLNRERDKFNSTPPNVGEDLQPSSIIQMRLDFTDEHKSELLMEKKQELFKTPIIPQKYLANTLSPTKHLTNEELNRPLTPTTSSPKALQEIKPEISAEKSITTNNDNINDDQVDVDGVYHQQHEFCNYLGLTGMSTATAMANAVAELAQCNLARRSMRVLRQQQQERRDKTAKEEKQLEALKMKQLKELRKREREGSDNNTPERGEEQTVIKSDECSHSQNSDPLTPLKETKKKTSNSNTKSSTKSQNSVTIIKKEPEIKILCHIAAKNKEKAEKLAKECIKDITQPIRESLIRQAKLQATDNKTLEEDTPNSIENMKIDKNSIEIKKEVKTDCKDETEQFKRSLRSPRITRSKTPITATTKTGTQIQNEFKNGQQDNEIGKIKCKLESLTDTGSEIKSLINKNLKQDHEMLKQNSLEDDFNLIKPDIHLINNSSSSIIQQKLQMALEESRKTKPSIFIVQSLESKKEQIPHKNSFNEISLEKQENLQDSNKSLKKSLKSGNKFHKNDLKRAYRTHKNKKYPTCKRKLRNRKIIVIKTLKPKQKSLESLKDIKRELRSSPRHHQEKQEKLFEPVNINNNKKLNKTLNNETKSYRTVHTETKDLEIYLKHHKTQTKTRLMAKASALLERSRRMTLRNNSVGVSTLNNTKIKSKLTPPAAIQRSKLNLHATRTQILKPSRLNNSEKFYTTPNITQQQPTSSNLLLDNDNVVVSSTTNNYDERPLQDSLALQSPITLRSLHNTASYVIASSPIQTKEQFTQCSINTRVQYLNTPPLATQVMRNPLKSDYGKVLYIYLELDILIVIQERLISFWKCSKLINILSLMPNATTKPPYSHQMMTQHHHQQGETTASSQKQSMGDHYCNNQMRQPASSSSSNFMDSPKCGEWLQLGELRRLNYDFEISVPYANRICLHNSTPIYLEMRAKQLPKNQRDCNLLSMYINIYYYHDEDMIAKCNSIALDTIQSDINLVNYTTLIDSRYFIMTWPQENLLGKTRSGLCKYSLTPQLDTLASIREFKSMRHTIRYLECMSDDKLIGFGDTQVTIWDHRSGDVLMNFDLEIPLGKNLGSIYFSSHDIEQNNILILHQYRDNVTTTPQLMTLACTVTHNQPSYRVLQEINLPMPAFKNIQSAINSGDHLVVTGENNQELWISTTNPGLINVIQTIENSKRFYTRERTQLIELTEQTLSVNTTANHIMQLAAKGLVLN